MNKAFPITTLLLCGLALAGTRAQADPSSAKKWSRVENNSGKVYILTNTDATSKTTVGSLWCRKAGEKGNGKRITVKGDSYNVVPGNHEFYFDTTATRFAMHLKLQDASTSQSIGLHVTNMDPMVSGTEIQISASPLNTCNLLLDPTGYRNADGGVLFTLRPFAGTATSDE